MPPVASSPTTTSAAILLPPSIRSFLRTQADRNRVSGEEWEGPRRS